VKKRPGPRLSTVPASKPPAGPRRPPPPRRPPQPPPPARRVAHVIDEGQVTLLDVIDNLLNRGVVINADVVLGLAGVDLVFLRLAAILCSADRLIAPRDGS
jgi:hypothetical protein